MCQRAITVIHSIGLALEDLNLAAECQHLGLS
jgi:ornithine cyclodeaminase/alanine dehydrogenase-like protein (mu-crystallin family)